MTPVLELEDASRVFPGHPPIEALRSATLVAEERELLAVTGPSGHGKSTLLNLVGLLDKPTSGRVVLMGQDTSGWNERERCRARAKHIGFIFQSFHLLPERTVAENIEVSLIHQGVRRAKRDAAIEEVLGAVDMLNRYDAEARTLSGGEQQRTAIARSIVGSPTLLLCDEPTGNLDAGNADNIMDIVEKLSEQMTVIIVTHSERLASRTRRRVSIHNGRLQDVRR